MPDNLQDAGINAIVKGYENYVAQTKGMDDATQKMAGGMQTAAGHASGLGSSVAGTAAGFITAQLAMRALSGGFDLLIGNAANFEKNLDAVGAVSGATSQEFGQLADVAKRIGADTAFSAGEAVSAMQSLAQNGISVTDIMSGAADATAALAAAGGTDLVSAADTVSTAMSVWGLNTGQMTDAVNRLAGAANVSRFDVQDMSQAIAQGGGAASAAGVNFADFTTTIAGIAQYFSSGSDAGTSFKTFLTRLVPTADAAKDAMKSLGLITADGANQFFTAEGKMKSMAEIAGVLHGAIQGLSDEQRTQALSTIFGTDSMRAAIGIANLTEESFAALSKTMGDTSAADVAAQRMGNLSGDFENLKGSVETAGIALGTMLLPMLSKVVGGATELTNAFTNLPESTQQLALGFTAVALAMPLVISGGGKIIGIFQSMAGEGATLTGRLTGVALGIGALALAADAILQQTTGHGLVEWVFGSPQQADAIAAAIDRVNFAMKNLGQTHVDAMIGEVSRLNSTWNALDEDSQRRAVEMPLLFGQAVGTDKQIRSIIGALQEGKASFAEYQTVLEQLPAPLQASFRELTNFDQMQRQVAASQGLWAKGQQDAQAVLLDSAVNIAIVTEAAGKLGNQTDVVKGAGDRWYDSLDHQAGKLADVNKALTDLMTTFATANPVYADLAAQNAILDLEIDKLVKRTGDLSAPEQAHLQALKDQKQANTDLMGSMKLNEDAANTMSKAIELLIGPTALGGLKAAMTDAGRGLDDQIGVLSTIAGAYHSFASGDIPATEAALDGLKAKLSPAEWEPVASGLVTTFGNMGTESGNAIVEHLRQGGDKLGPTLKKVVDEAFISTEPGAYDQAFHLGSGMATNVGTGVTDTPISGEVEQLVDAGITAGTARAAGAVAVGNAFGTGVASGISNSTGAVSNAATNVIQNALNAVSGLLILRSPSHLTADEIGVPFVQGIAMGINEGAGALYGAVVTTMANAVTVGSQVAANIQTQGMLHLVTQVALQELESLRAAHASVDALAAAQRRLDAALGAQAGYNPYALGHENGPAPHPAGPVPVMVVDSSGHPFDANTVPSLATLAANYTPPPPSNIPIGQLSWSGDGSVIYRWDGQAWITVGTGTGGIGASPPGVGMTNVGGGQAVSGAPGTWVAGEYSMSGGGYPSISAPHQVIPQMVRPQWDMITSFPPGFDRMSVMDPAAILRQVTGWYGLGVQGNQPQDISAYSQPLTASDAAERAAAGPNPWTTASGGHWGPADPFTGQREWIPNAPQGWGSGMTGSVNPITGEQLSAAGGINPFFSGPQSGLNPVGSQVGMPWGGGGGGGGLVVFAPVSVDFSGAQFLERADTIQHLVEDAVGNVIDDQLGRAADLLGHSFSGPTGH